MITVVVVDDHAVVREGVLSFLQTQPDIEVVGEAASGLEAVRVCADVAPDVVLMDASSCPTSTALKATRQVKAISPRTQIIVLTSYHDDEHIVPAIRASAHLVSAQRRPRPTRSANAIRLAAQGEGTLHPAIAVKVVDALRRQSETSDRIADLTDRETEVLRLIAGGIF